MAESGVQQSIDFLRQQQQRLAGQSLVQEAATVLLDTIATILPQKIGSDSGHLRQALLENSGVQQTDSGWSYGAGNLERLGDPIEYAPKGTIREFLDWYRTTQQIAKTERIERRKGAELRFYIRQQEAAIRKAERKKFETGGSRGQKATYRSFFKPNKAGETRLSRMRSAIDELNRRLEAMERTSVAGVIRGQEAQARNRRARLLAIYHAVSDQTEEIERHRSKLRGYRRRLSSLGFR